mmetsp:Transcript_13493/g.46668  ORF Transcript_13493/g.46668 Transcript_13493/m.46668 type:complete len:487 (-) Transcript_13493:1191-2651(-)
MDGDEHSQAVADALAASGSEWFDGSGTGRLTAAGRREVRRNFGESAAARHVAVAKLVAQGFAASAARRALDALGGNDAEAVARLLRETNPQPPTGPLDLPGAKDDVQLEPPPAVVLLVGLPRADPPEPATPIPPAPWAALAAAQKLAEETDPAPAPVPLASVPEPSDEVPVLVPAPAMEADRMSLGSEALGSALAGKLAQLDKAASFEEALKTMAQEAEDASTRKRRDPVELALSEDIGLLVEVLADSTESLQVHMSAATALVNLVRNQDQALRMMKCNVVRHVQSRLQSPATDHMLASALLDLLHELVESDTAGPELYNGPYEILHASLMSAAAAITGMAHSQPAVALSGAMAMWKMLRYVEPNTKGTIVNVTGAPKALITAMQSFSTDRDLQYACGGMLLSLARDSEEAQLVLAELGAAHLIRQALARYTNIAYHGEFDSLRGWLRANARARPPPPDAVGPGPAQGDGKPGTVPEISPAGPVPA